MATRVKKKTKEHIAIIAAVIVIITAFILLWWYCAFLPSWIEWKTVRTDYGEGFIQLKDRHLSIYDNENDDKHGNQKDHCQKSSDYYLKGRKPLPKLLFHNVSPKITQTP